MSLYDVNIWLRVEAEDKGEAECSAELLAEELVWHFDDVLDGGAVAGVHKVPADEATV